MLKIHIEPQEIFDEENQVFYTTGAETVTIAHSLLSVAKWEAKWHKAYLPSKYERGVFGMQEEISYIECMLIGKYSQHAPSNLYFFYNKVIREYINDPYSATTVHRINHESKPGNTVTAEVIYYWMIKFNIPIEFEKWHLNRLLTLIDVISVKESGQSDKMSRLEWAKHRQKINEQRKKALQ